MTTFNFDTAWNKLTRSVDLGLGTITDYASPYGQARAWEMSQTDPNFCRTEVHQNVEGAITATITARLGDRVIRLRGTFDGKWHFPNEVERLPLAFAWDCTLCGTSYETLTTDDDPLMVRVECGADRCGAAFEMWEVARDNGRVK